LKASPILLEASVKASPILQGTLLKASPLGERDKKKKEEEDDVLNYSASNESRSSGNFSIFAKVPLSKGAALLVAALVATYALATQFTGAPNYDASYDGMMPPKGAYGPVTIRKDRDDIGVIGYGSKDCGGRCRRDRR
jgi:hypothetical protein